MQAVETARITGKFVPPTADTIERERKHQWQILNEIRQRIITAKSLRRSQRDQSPSWQGRDGQAPSGS